MSTSTVLAAWRRAEYTETWLRFTPTGRAGDVMDEVTRAVWATNNLFDDGPDSDFVFVEGPWPAPVGKRAYLVLLSSTTYEPGIIRWLNGFAAHLEAADLTGKVTSVRQDDIPCLEMTYSIGTPQLRTFLAYTMTDPSPPRDRPFGWNVPDPVTTQVAALTERDWFPGADTVLGAGLVLALTPEAAATALGRYLPRDCIASVAHIRVEPARVAHTDFDVNGMTTRTIYDPGQSWQDRLVQCVDRLTALPEATDIGFVQHAVGVYNGWFGLGEPPTPPWVEYTKYTGNPHLRTRFVPDARGVMLLSDGHLERAYDLSNWTIEPLGHGRHLVQAPDLAAWYAQPVPHPDVLVQARSDFGRMILTPVDLAENPPP
ncbi:MAG: hypothetical protein WKF86_00615 [Acidimicrobiales bacterium]